MPNDSMITDLAKGMKPKSDGTADLATVTKQTNINVTDLARGMKAKGKEEQNDINIKAVEESSLNNGFTNREPEKTIQPRNKYSETFTTRMRAGMGGLIRDISHETKITNQELLEQAIRDFLEKKGMLKLLAKYHEIVNDG